MGWYQRRVLFFFFFFFFFGQSLNFYLFLEPLTRTHKSQRTDNGDYCTVHTSCTLRRDSRELEVEPTARHPSNIQQKASTTHSYSMQDSGPRMNSWPLSRRVLSYCVPKKQLGWPKASNRARSTNAMPKMRTTKLGMSSCLRCEYFLPFSQETSPPGKIRKVVWCQHRSSACRACCRWRSTSRLL